MDLELYIVQALKAVNMTFRDDLEMWMGITKDEDWWTQCILPEVEIVDIAITKFLTITAHY